MRLTSTSLFLYTSTYMLSQSTGPLLQLFHNSETHKGTGYCDLFHLIALRYIGNQAKWIFHMDKSCFLALVSYHMAYIHFS